jgi:hypothetical protein
MNKVFVVVGITEDNLPETFALGTYTTKQQAMQRLKFLIDKGEKYDFSIRELTVDSDYRVML